MMLVIELVVAVIEAVLITYKKTVKPSLILLMRSLILVMRNKT